MDSSRSRSRSRNRGRTDTLRIRVITCRSSSWRMDSNSSSRRMVSRQLCREEDGLFGGVVRVLRRKGSDFCASGNSSRHDGRGVRCYGTNFQMHDLRHRAWVDLCGWAWVRVRVMANGRGITFVVIFFCGDDDGLLLE